MILIRGWKPKPNNIRRGIEYPNRIVKGICSFKLRLRQGTGVIQAPNWHEYWEEMNNDFN